MMIVQKPVLERSATHRIKRHGRDEVRHQGLQTCGELGLPKLEALESDCGKSQATLCFDPHYGVGCSEIWEGHKANTIAQTVDRPDAIADFLQAVAGLLPRAITG